MELTLTRTPAQKRPWRTPTSRRHLAARVGARLGMLNLIRRARLNRGLLVMAYHRVGDPATCPVDDDLICASPQGLADHVRLMQRWLRVVSLDEVVDRYDRGPQGDEPQVLITFDDVYRDNYEQALPILRQAGAPAVFFVPTGLIEQRHVPWWDRIAYAVKHSRADRLCLAYPEPLQVDGLQREPLRACLALLRLYKSRPEIDKERFLQGVEAAAGTSALHAPEVGELFATWSQLAEMRDAGMALESHTHTHCLLSHLPYEGQRAELERSRDLLRERLGVQTRAVAYPVGGREHFNDDTRRTLADLGYRLGFSHYGGWNPTSDDRYDIRRVRVDMSVDTHMLHATAALPSLFST